MAFKSVAGLLPTTGLSYTYTSRTVSPGSPARIEIGKGAYLIRVTYVYNNTHAVFIVTPSELILITKKLPSPISITLTDSSHYEISSDSGQYGLGIGTISF